MNTGTGDNLGFEDTHELLNPFAEAYKEYLQETEFGVYSLPNEESIIQATYISHNDESAVLSTQYKTDVIVPMHRNDKAIADLLKNGEEVEVYVTKVINRKNQTEIYGSMYDVQVIRTNELVRNTLDKLYEKNKTLIGIPTDYNIYGYNVSVNVEYNEITLHLPHLLTDMNKLPNPESIIGEEINFYLKKDDRGNYIASRKDYLKEKAKEELKDIVIGDIYTGFVTGATKRAIFVQIGNLTGMVHISNLSDEGKQMLIDGKVEAGMRIDTYVKSVSNKGLNLTQVWKDSLWDSIEVGDILSGDICDVITFGGDDFGVMVKLDFETKGMIHSKNLNRNIDYYKNGMELEVVVQRINKNKRQITLLLA